MARAERRAGSRTGRAARHNRSGLPSRTDIANWLRDNPDVTGPREIARAFGLVGPDRLALKSLLREMKQEGLVGAIRRSPGDAGPGLPPVGLADIVATDDSGDLWAIPAVLGGSDAADDDNVPRLKVIGLKRGPAPARLGVGDRVLARFVPLQADEEHGASGHEARVIRRLDRREPKRLGIVAGGGRGLRIIPVSKRSRDDVLLDKADARGAELGDLVTFTLQRGPRGRPRQAKVAERHGPATSPSMVSLIAIHEADIPVEFSPEALAEAEAARLPQMGKRTDLRKLPLVTIDPADARDHDDAVHAAPDPDPKNADGWIVTVAIADVAAFVSPGSALDAEARKRGNSVYFPDRVVPMLPEALSAGLCSLREGEDRPVMAVRMVVDAAGKVRRHEFFRAMMRSAASLTYEDVQRAWDGAPSEKTAALVEDVLTPLWGAYDSLAMARTAREPLDLNIPERRIRVDASGRPTGVETPPRLEAHRLIEELMVQANVAAAETLDRHRIGFLRRIHDAPAAEKVDALGEYLKTLDLRLAKGQVMLPRHFNRLLRDAAAGPNSEAVHDAVLRAQSQAAYAPEDLGHFGLNLRRYAHFTSPIRRYADIVVHRALITAEGLGPDGLDQVTIAALAEIGAEVSDAERRAMRAERDTVDRLIAHFLGSRIGGEFDGRVTGIARSGLFVGLAETGADGFVPAASLKGGYFEADEALRALVDVDTGDGYRVGDAVRVRLAEADPLRGQIAFDMLTQPRPVRKPGRSRRKAGGQRPRGTKPPRSRRHKTRKKA